MKSQPEKKYCLTCGALRIPFLKKGAFDTKTGKEDTFYVYKCPNKHWWNIFHDEEVSWID